MTDLPIRVLQSFPEPRTTTNPYLIQLMASLPDDVEVLTFSWRRALLARWEVFHVHWPETLLQGRTRPRALAHQLLSLLLLVRIRLTRRALVRTMHNLRPHEPPGRQVRRILALFDRWTTQTIDLSAATIGVLDRPAALIPHGDYAAWFADHDPSETVPGRLLFFGMIRPYKQVPALVSAFSAMPDRDLSLHVVGRPHTSELAAEIVAAGAGDRRITFEFGHAGDAQLVAEVTSAEAVVLPYQEMINSGAALLALSLKRPIIVPESTTTTELAEEVGPGWVVMLGSDGVDLTAKALADALHRLRAAAADRSSTPNLERRGWARIGAQHAAVYRASFTHARVRSLHGRDISPA